MTYYTERSKYHTREAAIRDKYADDPTVKITVERHWTAWKRATSLSPTDANVIDAVLCGFTQSRSWRDRIFIVARSV